jgi:hypothetical protein
MDWRHRRYFAIKLPKVEPYYSGLIKMIKSIPTAKIRFKTRKQINEYWENTDEYSSYTCFDEENSRYDYTIMVSLSNEMSIRWLWSALSGFNIWCVKGFGIYATEIEPRYFILRHGYSCRNKGVNQYRRSKIIPNWNSRRNYLNSRFPDVHT